MSDRVLTTATARDAITAFQAIVTGPLLDQITQLHNKGQVLSQPENWDGRLATEFRAPWIETLQRLLGVKQNLEDLRTQIQQINQNIMQAGGNA